MPTARAWTFAFTAFMLYFFANQTQVGWLYVMSALLAGVLAAAWWASRRGLHGVQAQRRLSGSLSGSLSGPASGEYMEGDEVSIELAFQNQGKTPAAHIRTQEQCPLAAPFTPLRDQPIFIPLVQPGEKVSLQYEVEIDRRGLHTFPPLRLTTGYPFSFFRRSGQVQAPLRLLVYPQVRPLRRFALLHRQIQPQAPTPRAGYGTEFVGVRPYRQGDSLRHIHWRSVARTGQLISKEFADEAQPGLTIVLDLFAHPYPLTPDKHTPFEWAIKIAASIGDYALRLGYPLYLATDEEVLPAPPGPLSRDALLQYLARLQPEGRRPLAETLLAGVQQSFVALLLPWPDPSLSALPQALQRRGLQSLAVLLDPRSFPAGGPSAAPLADQVAKSGTPTSLVRFGEDWTLALAEEAAPVYGLPEAEASLAPARG